jgi:hypothetical protein
MSSTLIKLVQREFGEFTLLSISSLPLPCRQQDKNLFQGNHADLLPTLFLTLQNAS